MALITPEDIREYTIFDEVIERTDARLSYDIIQAQQDVFAFVGHRFELPIYTPLPEVVKLALVKVSEYYALINSDDSLVKGFKSEKIGDYSYTAGEGSETSSISLSNLLKDYVLPSAGGKLHFRMLSV